MKFNNAAKNDTTKWNISMRIHNPANDFSQLTRVASLNHKIKITPVDEGEDKNWLLV